MNSVRAVSAVIGVTFLLVACSAPLREDIIFEGQSTQLQIRSIQSRVFDTADRIKALRAIIATLQDLDFVIDQADSRVGVIIATRMSGYLLTATVMVTENDSNRLLIRARMQTGWLPLAKQVRRELSLSRPISDEAYQEFFYSLRKNMFLVSHWPPLPKKSTSH